MRIYPRPVRAFFLFWLLPALACNFPTVAQKPPSVTLLESTLTPVASPSFPMQESTSPARPEPTLPPRNFAGLATATPGDPHSRLSEDPDQGDRLQFFDYLALPGDTLSAVARRFGVDPDQVVSPQDLPEEGYLAPGQLLVIPNVVGYVPYPSSLLPDSEVIYAPSTVDFDIRSFIQSGGGYLSMYSEMVDGERLSDAEIIQRVAVENSINPRVLLAFLEYRSQWVYGQPGDPFEVAYPIGFYAAGRSGLYKELSLAALHLGLGYYGWRLGTKTELVFPDGSTTRLSPSLNAGSVALQYLFSKFYRQGPWLEALYGPSGFLALYKQMFGDPWIRAASVEPLLHPGLAQPAMELPFRSGERWSFSGGPHKSLNSGTPPGAIDFSPVTGDPPCAVSRAWATASAPGVVTRSDNRALALDLDGDGYEQTGWVLVYLHVANRERVPPGTWVNTDDQLGHPSCQGGDATGANVHMARKYNGEWLPAAGPLPFVLSGWEVQAGTRSYEGYLVKGNQVVTARPDGTHLSIITR